jgi:hypothetical protein
MPACFSMLLSVPIGISRTGRGTVTRPGFTGCWNCLWLPTCATSYQPSCFNRRMISRLDTRKEYTLYTHLSRRRSDRADGRPRTARLGALRKASSRMGRGSGADRNANTGARVHFDKLLLRMPLDYLNARQRARQKHWRETPAAIQWEERTSPSMA